MPQFVFSSVLACLCFMEQRERMLAAADRASQWPSQSYRGLKLAVARSHVIKGTLSHGSRSVDWGSECRMQHLSSIHFVTSEVRLPDA